MSTQVLRQALSQAGVTCIENEQKSSDDNRAITKTRLFSDGFIGSKNSAKKRGMLQKKLGLPENMSSGLLCEIINLAASQEEYEKIVKEIEDECE